MPQDPAKPPGALGKPDKPTSPTAEKPDHTDGTTPTQPGTDRVDTAAPVPKKDSNDTKPHIGSDPVKDASETKPTTAADPKKGAGETKPENDVKTNGGKDISVPAIDPKKPGAEVKPSTTPFSVLRARPFILKTVKHETADATPRVTGSILSQSLDKMLATGGPVQAETLTMAALRKLVPEMSRYPSIDKFCTPSGTLIDDEAISIIDYLALEAPEEAPSTGGTPVLKLHFRPTKMGELAGKGANGTEAGAVTAPDLTKAPAVTAPTGPVATLLPKREAANPLLDAAQYGGIQVQTSDGAGKLSETQWSVVLRNCAVFYGWIIDPRTKRAIRAPKPAFKLRSKVNQQAVASIPDFVVNTSREAGPLNEANSKSSDAQSIESKSVKAVTPKSEEGIPNFRVNDDSRIEITAHSDELSVSMAKSDFSSESTEVSVSGGGYGVSVGVSAGYAKSSEKSLQENSNSKSQTIVGRYMFPRCDLLMWPNELEPTDELAELLETVRRTKNIKVLRRLQAEYGNLFCQRVTLGGRLMTTKTVQIDEKTTVEAEKSSFKLALGASVSGSYAGISASASVKHEKSEGGSKTEETSTRSQHEACVFEAVGGETILATDPKAWSPTVANHELWRIINREALSSLVEILSQMPEYDAVQSWFVQAVPALNQYMTLDAGHQCKARLRVTAPGNSLMITNNGSDASFYLGHDPSNAVTPRLSSVDTAEGKFWERHGVMLSEPIFHPTTYRAPAIFGYNISSVGDAPYGSKYNKEYAMTTWDIIAPFDEELLSGTRVILRSCPFGDPTPNALVPQPSHMVVFRNAQGEFVPAMSDSDEYQYWRIISTTDDDTSSSWGPRHIQPGDNVRLCWDFSDQTTGWRDFTQDVFGRRQPCAPADVQGPLFLKVPWPRFEDVGTPTALIMSPDPAELSTKPVAVRADNMGRSNFHRYAMQDLRLRIDSIFNGVKGDTDDYTLKDLQQAKPMLRFGGFTLQLRADIFWFGIH